MCEEVGRRSKEGRSEKGGERKGARRRGRAEREGEGNGERSECMRRDGKQGREFKGADPLE